MPKPTTQKARLPVKIPEAHLDFVLIGPHNGDQTVLAQSKHLDVLLLGMARAPAHLTVPRTSKFSEVPWPQSNHSKTFPGLYENDPQATLYSVTAVANVTDQPESREEPFTFAWIGRSPDVDLEPIRDYFRNCAVSLHQATQDDDPVEKMRWHLAPLLFLCAKCTKTTRESQRQPADRVRQLLEVERQSDRARLYLLTTQMITTVLALVSLAFALFSVLHR